MKIKRFSMFESIENRFLNINEYPYGLPRPDLHDAVEWLNNNMDDLISAGETQYEFDFPCYWKMPKNISKRLSADEVDWIQSVVGDSSWLKNQRIRMGVCDRCGDPNCTLPDYEGCENR